MKKVGGKGSHRACHGHLKVVPGQHPPVPKNLRQTPGEGSRVHGVPRRWPWGSGPSACPLSDSWVQTHILHPWREGLEHRARPEN